MTGEYDFIKDVILPSTAIIISIIAIIVSGLTWKKARPIEQKQYDADSLLTCFKILSESEVRRDKQIIGEERRTLISQKQPIIFDRTQAIQDYADKIEEAYNEVSALYLLDLLNKNHFKHVYGGGLVTWWKILKDDIDSKQTPSRNICKHFREVAEEFMKSGVNDEPY